MRKISLLLAVLAMLAFVFGACNPGGGPGAGDADATDVIFTWGQPQDDGTDTGVEFDLTQDSNNYPGREINLDECPNISDGKGDDNWVLGDITNYSEVIIHAILYDKDDKEVTEGTSLAHFSILKAGSSGWDDANKLAEKYNLESRKDIAASPTAGAKGLAGKLLVQGSYTQDEPGVVTKVLVQKLTFKLDTGKPVFIPAYGDTFLTGTSGSKIVFNNAEYSDAAVWCDLSKILPADMTGKSLVFKFTIEDSSATEGHEYQIHVQAANGSDKFNGMNDPSGETGQKYITLNDNSPEGKYKQTWDGTSGSFTILLDDLLTAAAAAAGKDQNDCKGPIDPLNAIRICNNGTEWAGDGKNHIRDKSYSVTFTSITVE